MKVILFILLVTISFNFFCQSSFNEKYDISSFMTTANSSNKLKMFKEFKIHLEENNYRFDSPFRNEYELELNNYPLALHFLKKYKRKRVAAYVINGASALLMGVALIPLDQFLAGFIGGLVGTQLYSLPVHLFSKVNFSESLLIYYSEIKKIEN